MTSRGVFPNTLAAPAIAPKAPVNKGLMALLGSSPNGGASSQTVRRRKEERKGRCSCRSDFTLTFVPVLQRGHDVEADCLVGALFQDGGGEALVRPPQSWWSEDVEGGV